MRATMTALLLALLALAPPAYAEEPARIVSQSETPAAPPDLEESYVRMKRTGGLSPFELIEDTVVLRGATPTAIHAKDVVNQSEHQNRMALMTLAEYRALLDALEAQDILILRDFEIRPRREDLPSWSIEYQRNGRRNSIRIHGLRFATDPRYRAIVDLIRGTVREKTGEVPFRNVFFDAGEVGWLNLETRPAAHVEIDGAPTKERTPLYAWELPRGSHSVRLVDEERGIDRSFDFTVEAGMTTILNLDLW